MDNQARVSAFLLERYHIGEITAEEKAFVENALTRDPALAADLAELDRGDRDFRRKFPRELFFTEKTREARPPAFRPRKKRVPLAWAACAAALALVVALPLLVTRNAARTGYTDRLKGNAAGVPSAELSVYLKGEAGNGADAGSRLPDQALVRAGNTVQLAYRVRTDDAEKHGVIFSIDGRSSVTAHYPYSPEQSTQLDTGGTVPLNEAYTLDDAPDCEVFFFVVKDEPLDVRGILDTARRIAPAVARDPRSAPQKGAAAFKGCELKTLTLLKE